MNPTNEQIIAEAHRRFVEEQRNHDGLTPESSSLANHIIEVMRENWTPPEPVVDPDLLAFREWFAHLPGRLGTRGILAGRWDASDEAKAYLAGASMAREQEQERAKELVELAKTWARFDSEATRVINRYRGEA